MPTGGAEREVVDRDAGPDRSAAPAPPDPIASPPAGRARAVASAVIALWLLCQVALPASYYLGDSLAEERFAWRMFSSVSVFGGQCVVSVVETVAAPAADGGRITRELSLDQVLHPAWGVHIRRGRRLAIDRFLAWRCRQDPSIVQIELRRSCARGPEAGTRLELVSPCASEPR